MKIMKRHSQIGGDAIRLAIVKVSVHLDTQDRSRHRTALTFLNVAEAIATHHHERWDGSGYPDCLSGKDIPLSARLMAVADVFDALTTKRVYKEAIAVDIAVDYIRQQRGFQFDPDVVDAFLNCYDEFVAIAGRYTERDAES
jgi:putative two-component system response regulator